MAEIVAGDMTLVFLDSRYLQDLETVLRYAIPLSANNDGLNVGFRFNGVGIVVNADSNPEEVIKRYGAEFTRVSEERANTPEALARAAEDKRDHEERTRITSARLTEQLDGMDDVLKKGTAATLAWINDVVPLADDVGFLGRDQEVIEKLEGAGYKREDGRINEGAMVTAERLARYIVGGVIGYLRSGILPPVGSVRRYSAYYPLLTRQETGAIAVSPP